MNAPATQSNLADARRRWARQLLELPAEPGPGGSAGEVLRRLQDTEFVPSSSWRQAMHALVSSPEAAASVLSPRGHDSLLSLGEERLRAEVQEFAARFFQLPPDERRERWQKLRSSTGLTPASALRLDALADGLDLDAKAPSGGDSDVRELADVATHLATLRPGHRAQLRRQKLAELGSDLGRWQRAAARLQRDLPQVATLVPDLLHGLERGQVSHQPVPLFRRLPTQAASTEGRQTSGASRGSLWWVGLVVIAVLAVARGVNSYSSRSTPSYPTPMPNYKPLDIERLLHPPPQPDPSGEEELSEKSRLDALIQKILREREESRKPQEGATPAEGSPPPGSPGVPPTTPLQPGEAFRRLFDDPPPGPPSAPSRRPQ